MPDARRKPSIPWAWAGLGIVVLALLLAAFGLVLAIRQSRALATLKVDEPLPAARELADRLQSKLTRRVDRAARDAAEHYQEHPEIDPTETVAFPEWVNTVYAWDGERFSSWSHLPTPVTGDGERQRRITTVVRGRLRTTLALAWLGPAPPPTGFLHDRVGHDPLLLYQIVDLAPGGKPFVVAAAIDLPRLRTELLDPEVAANENLQLVDADEPAPAWSVRLVPTLGFWALQPTSAFVDRQQSRVRVSTALNVTFMISALVALLYVVWMIARLVRREMALSQMKSNFVAAVSHELKTPLTMIQMFGEMLHEGRAPSAEKAHEYSGVIVRESKRLTHLINNILDFARLEAGRQVDKQPNVDVGAVVRETFDTYRHELDRQGFATELTVAEDLPRLTVDPGAIAQAMVNLIGNSIKYSDTDRFLGVSVEKETRRGRHGVLISVRDRGIGIRPEDRLHLFKDFYRADDTRVRERRGAGLGLALVERIVRAHHGVIHVESRLVKGTAFRIFLPQMECDNESTT